MLASDLYLAARWNDFPDRDPTTRRTEIFAAYIALGVAGRWPYHQAARRQTSLEESNLPADVVAAIAASRTPHERFVARALSSGSVRAWLRISYTGESRITPASSFDELLMALSFTVSSSDEEYPILDDAERYDFASDWEAMLCVLPELVDSYAGAWEPAEHAERIREAREGYEQGVQELEEEGIEDEEEFEAARRDLLDDTHHDFVTGCFWVHDAETDEDGTALLVWVDEFGKVIRENRLKDVTDWSGMFVEWREDDCEIWTKAWIGEKYNAQEFEQFLAA